jgi:hypothetical protein
MAATTFDYFKRGSVAHVPVSDGFLLVITRVNDDVSHACLIDEAGQPVVELGTNFECLNCTTDTMNPPFKDGWLLSWTCTYFIKHKSKRIAVIECQRTHEIYGAAPLSA